VHDIVVDLVAASGEAAGGDQLLGREAAKVSSEPVSTTIARRVRPRSVAIAEATGAKNSRRADAVIAFSGWTWLSGRPARRRRRRAGATCPAGRDAVWSSSMYDVVMTLVRCGRAAAARWAAWAVWSLAVTGARAAKRDRPGSSPDERPATDASTSTRSLAMNSASSTAA
jgi:hypothetical protein